MSIENHSRLTPALANFQITANATLPSVDLKPQRLQPSLTLPTPPKTNRRRLGNTKNRLRLEFGGEEEDQALDQDDIGGDDERERIRKRRRVHVVQSGEYALPVIEEQPATSSASNANANAIASPPATPVKSLITRPALCFQTPKRHLNKSSFKDEEDDNPFLDSDDDEDNPFLDKENKLGVGIGATTSNSDPEREWVEPEMMTYVFRGKKVQFPNSYYLPHIPSRSSSPTPLAQAATITSTSTTKDLFSSTANLAAQSVRDRARADALALHARISDAKAKGDLPIEHEDYEMYEGCRPRVLFPDTRSKKSGRK